MTVPPRKSTPRFRPLTARKMTAATNVTNEMMLNTSACRMNGMSREMRKNSIAACRVGESGAGLRLDRHGRGNVGRRLPHLANRDVIELLPAAVDQRDDAARDEHGREHRRQDAEDVDDGEATHRSRAEREQRNAGDHRRYVRVEDRSPRALVARLDRRMRRRAPAQLLA